MPHLQHSISVRELVEFVWKRGNLTNDGGFSHPDRAREGVEGHKRVQELRPTGYVRERIVRAEIQSATARCTVRGRIDGFWILNKTLFVEEIKTRIKPILPRPEIMELHWGQVMIYSRLLLQETVPPPNLLQIRLTYLTLADDSLEELSRDVSLEEVNQFYDTTVRFYLEWLDLQNELNQQRTTSLAHAPFPFATFRPGQRDLAKAVYRSAKKGHWTFAEAPTGIGKTISTLYPAVKALGEALIDRVLYLTAKTSGRIAAEEAVEQIRSMGVFIRSLTLMSRDRICISVNGEPCQIKSCPKALGYFDRRHAVLRELTRRECLNADSLRLAAQEHLLCPYALSRDLAPWVDVVIGDYNHAFDPKARLPFLDANPTGTFALVDEAHNLIDRAREMFSATLVPAGFEKAARKLHASSPATAKAAKTVARSLRGFIKSTRPSTDPNDKGIPESEIQNGTSNFNIAAEQIDLVFEEAVQAEISPPPNSSEEDVSKSPASLKSTSPLPFNSRAYGPGQWTTTFPDVTWTEKLSRFIALLGAWLAENLSDDPENTYLVDLFFESTNALATLRAFAPDSECMVEANSETRIRIFNTDPGPRLRKRIEELGGAVFFSATLSPLDFFKASLGGSSEDVILQLNPPFPPENLCVILNDRIATRYKARGRSTEQVATCILSLVGAHVGNYLVFFPSFAYLTTVIEQLRSTAIGPSLLVQTMSMTEASRKEFLSRFQPNPKETTVGIAVMGGLFGEGIDLVGDRLSGAIIVGVGLPQLCFERDVIRAHFEGKGLDGFAYSYLYPGMNRVLQAVGRVIRSETDRGVVLLMDERYGELRYRRLLPPNWDPQVVRSSKGIGEQASVFWDKTKNGESS